MQDDAFAGFSRQGLRSKADSGLKTAPGMRPAAHSLASRTVDEQDRAVGQSLLQFVERHVSTTGCASPSLRSSVSQLQVGPKNRHRRVKIQTPVRPGRHGQPDPGDFGNHTSAATCGPRDCAIL